MHTQDGCNHGTSVGTGGQPTLVGMDETDTDGSRLHQTVKVFGVQSRQYLQFNARALMTSGCWTVSYTYLTLPTLLFFFFFSLPLPASLSLPLSLPLSLSLSLTPSLSLSLSLPLPLPPSLSPSPLPSTSPSLPHPLPIAHSPPLFQAYLPHVLYPSSTLPHYP